MGQSPPPETCCSNRQALAGAPRVARPACPQPLRQLATLRQPATPPPPFQDRQTGVRAIKPPSAPRRPRGDECSSGGARLPSPFGVQCRMMSVECTLIPDFEASVFRRFIRSFAVKVIPAQFVKIRKIGVSPCHPPFEQRPFWASRPLCHLAAIQSASGFAVRSLRWSLKSCPLRLSRRRRWGAGLSFRGVVDRGCRV